MSKAILQQLVAAIVLIPSFGWAANRYVRPGAAGTGSGQDWTNAYTNLPSTLSRGDIYYLADGNYGSYTFDDANSGSTLITIQKATIADHGIQTGWSDTFGDGQAIFSSWQIYTDYYKFNGVSRNSTWETGAFSQYGIKVSSSGPLRLDNGVGVGGDNLTFQYIDFQAGGTRTGAGDDVVYGLASNSNITFQYCALHDSDRTIFLLRGEWQNLLVEYSYLARNTSTPAIHGEMLSDIGSDNITFRYNVIEDIEGTAVWAVLNGSAPKSAGSTANNWKLYGNVIRSTPSYISGGRGGVASIIYVANDASNRNWADNLSYYNNTHISVVVQFYGIYMDIPGTGNNVKNNIWYACGPGLSHGNPGTIDYNWYYNTAKANDNGANTTTCTSNCSSYFNNIANRDATLIQPIPGLSLASEYNTGFAGNIRGADGAWDRGAYEFSGGTQSLPLPPTFLPTGVQ